MDRTSPRLSVIVRSMGRPTLRAALASIAAQDYPEVETVVVAASGPDHPPLDAGSGSATVVFVPSAVRLKRPLAANRGLDAATGDWLTFLDDDDVFLPGHLSALMAARSAVPAARWVYSYARGAFRDGHVEHFGQPHALIQLHERNYVHLSTGVFARSLLDDGCRFDESLDILEDWDFALQAAQFTTLHFVPLQSFQWNADAGDSGAGGGVNQDDARFAMFRDRVYQKWAPARDGLIDRVQPILQRASEQARAGQWDSARDSCRECLVASPNDPWALNLLAMIERSTGNLNAARAAQELAVAIRPLDGSFVYNLALLYRALGDPARALRCCERALALDDRLEGARRLLGALRSPS